MLLHYCFGFPLKANGLFYNAGGCPLCPHLTWQTIFIHSLATSLTHSLLSWPHSWLFILAYKLCRSIFNTTTFFLWHSTKKKIKLNYYSQTTVVATQEQQFFKDFLILAPKLFVKMLKNSGFLVKNQLASARDILKDQVFHLLANGQKFKPEKTWRWEKENGRTRSATWRSLSVQKLYGGKSWKRLLFCHTQAQHESNV